MSGTHDRSAWERHPNYDAMAGVLLAIHDRFREAARHLRGEAEEASLDRLHRMFRGLASALHHHHRIEEEVLFPAVERVSGAFPEELVTDHRELTDAIARVTTSLAGADRDEARSALEALETCLDAHLRREEARVVPVLLELHPSELYRHITSQ
jgi:iron-sulfur cluster repair protein YtfE (RIC family)